MPSRYARLDRLLAKHLVVSRKATRAVLAAGRVKVNGAISRDRQHLIGPFDRVEVDGEVLQAHSPRYLMLHKPAGVVSATRDHRHQTVLDLLEEPPDSDLHLAGRLDLNTTGLLLLTNDGRWSRHLSAPDAGVIKRYRVSVARPLDQRYVDAFAKGMHFPYEGITTRPAGLRILSDFEAEVTLAEGRYHQIKRMFGRFRNQVVSLHRVAVGALTLDPALAPGQNRSLTPDEREQAAANPVAAARRDND